MQNPLLLELFQVIAAWAALVRSGASGTANALGRYLRVAIPIVVGYGILLIALLVEYQLNKTKPAYEAGVVISFAVILLLGVGFLHKGCMLYRVLTKNNFSSKQARIVFGFSLAFFACLLLQAAVNLASGLSPVMMQDNNMVATMTVKMALNWTSLLLVVAMFWRAVKNSKPNMGTRTRRNYGTRGPTIVIVSPRKSTSL